MFNPRKKEIAPNFREKKTTIVLLKAGNLVRGKS